MLLIQACASIYNVVEFEVLEPATVSLPENVYQLLILNRAPITVDAFDKKDVEGIEPGHLMILDTLIIRSLQRGLLNLLRESPIERFHYPIWLDDRRRDTTALDDLILTKREVEDICRDSKADAILSLEFYSMDYKKQEQNFVNSSVLATRYYEISSIFKWNVYLPGSPRPFDTYTMVDTLYFTERLNGERVRILNTSQILSEAFYKSGQKYGRYLVPVWNRTTRTLYTGKETSLKKSARLTDRGEWEMAYAQWVGMSETGDSTLVAKAFYNMAVYQELQDHLDRANQLTVEALRHDSLDLIIVYQEEIETRILNRMELYKQVR